MESKAPKVAPTQQYYVLIPVQQKAASMHQSILLLLSVILLIAELVVIGTLLYETWNYISIIKEEPSGLLIILAVMYLFGMLKLTFHGVLIEHIRRGVKFDHFNSLTTGFKVCLIHELIQLSIFTGINYYLIYVREMEEMYDLLLIPQLVMAVKGVLTVLHFVVFLDYNEDQQKLLRQ